ncbi:MAG: RnfABCDGE type electron transport complex subunit G [Bacteroidales bacterium]|nr:RnfABCDGE type electron transport complex subunit G [Bacteroidales bacterium]
MAKKKESTLINMLVALFVITAVSGGVLGLVYSLTKDSIAKVELDKTQRAIDSVLVTDKPIAKYEERVIENLTYNLAYDDQDQLIGAAIKTYSNAGFNGKVELMVGILADGTINKVSVLSQNETPGLGANMDKPKFKNQFKGKNPASYKLFVKKDQGDVDAITAATISSRAFTEALRLAYDGFMANKAEFMNNTPIEDETPVEEEVPVEENNEMEGGQDNE